MHKAMNKIAYLLNSCSVEGWRGFPSYSRAGRVVFVERFDVRGLAFEMFRARIIG